MGVLNISFYDANLVHVCAREASYCGSQFFFHRVGPENELRPSDLVPRALTQGTILLSCQIEIWEFKEGTTDGEGLPITAPGGVVLVVWPREAECWRNTQSWITECWINTQFELGFALHGSSSVYKTERGTQWRLFTSEDERTGPSNHREVPWALIL